MNPNLLFEEYEQYMLSLKASRDWKNSIDTVREETEKKATIKNAIGMLKKGISIADISEITELPIEQIEKLLKETINN